MGAIRVPPDFSLVLSSVRLKLSLPAGVQMLYSRLAGGRGAPAPIGGSVFDLDTRADSAYWDRRRRTLEAINSNICDSCVLDGANIATPS